MRWVLALFAMAVAVPSHAQSVPFKMSGSLKGVITGGTFHAHYFNNSFTTTNIAGQQIELYFSFDTVPVNEFGDPALIVGDFGATVDGITPPVANYFYGSVNYWDQLGYGPMISYQVTGNRFLLSFQGRSLQNNSIGSLQLAATITEAGLINWRGVGNGRIETRSSSNTVPYDWQYSDVVFSATESNIVVQGLAAVPEPSSWALLILGFGAVGFQLRRRYTLINGYAT